MGPQRRHRRNVRLGTAGAHRAAHRARSRPHPSSAGRRAPSAWTYIRKHPVASTTTLPRLFDVPGIRGASAAQHDETAVGVQYYSYVISRLFREGHWQRDEVLTWCDRALAARLSDYECRWFRNLTQRISALKRPTYQ